MAIQEDGNIMYAIMGQPIAKILDDGSLDLHANLYIIDLE